MFMTVWPVCLKRASHTEVSTIIFRKTFQVAPTLLLLYLLIFWVLKDKTPTLSSNFHYLYHPLFCFFFHGRKMFIWERCTQKLWYITLISPISQNMKDGRKESKKGGREKNPLFPGRLGGSVSWASGSWYQLKSWSQSCGINPRLRLWEDNMEPDWDSFSPYLSAPPLFVLSPKNK